MTVVVLALGSNIGDRLANLRAALAALPAGGVRIHRSSNAWETPPVPADQPRYLNAVVSGETELGPLALLVLAKEIERRLGRRPGRRWGPRPVDVDVLFFGEDRVALPGLEIPHPRIRERAFVLAPLSEVWEGPLPGFGRTPLELLAAVDCAGLRRVGPLKG